MNRNKHLLLWSSLGVIALLAAAAYQENVLRPWRRLQREAHAAGRLRDVRLRQVVNPALKIADRCVTCHVDLAPDAPGGELAERHRALGHDPAQLGCTPCHGGQGRATDPDDAHGDVPFWPEPMLPPRFVQAGCGACHVGVGVPCSAERDRGLARLEQYDCFACHRIDGRGGTLRPGGAGGMEGPDLSRIGWAGYDSHWYEGHLARRDAAEGGPWRDAFGPIPEAHRRDMEAYLATCWGVDELEEAKSAFLDSGCLGCHQVRGFGGQEGPDLTLAGLKDPGRLDFRGVRGERTVANWHAEHLRRPAAVTPGSRMPAQALTARQVELLTLYLLSLRGKEAPGQLWPQDRARVERLGEREAAASGQTLYAALCSACHGTRGEGRRWPGEPRYPALADPDLLAAADDAFLRTSIAEGRTGRRMPAWGGPNGLRPREIERVIAYLRALAGQPAPEPPSRPWRRGDPAAGRALFAEHCAGCHGPQGEGTEAPALNHPGLLGAASDQLLGEMIARGRPASGMPGFARGSPAWPALAPEQIESLIAWIRTWEESQP